MTAAKQISPEDEAIIRRVAKILGYFIRERNPEEFQCLAVHNKKDIYRSDFAWFENDGFDDFFTELEALTTEYIN